MKFTVIPQALCCKMIVCNWLSAWKFFVCIYLYAHLWISFLIILMFISKNVHQFSSSVFTFWYSIFMNLKLLLCRCETPSNKSQFDNSVKSKNQLIWPKCSAIWTNMKKDVGIQLLKRMVYLFTLLMKWLHPCQS